MGSFCTPRRALYTWQVPFELAVSIFKMALVHYDHHGIRTRRSLTRRIALPRWGEECLSEELRAKKKFDAEMAELRVQSSALRDTLDMMRFATCCLDLISGPPPSDRSDPVVLAQLTYQPFSRPRNTIPDETMEVVEEIKVIERRRKDLVWLDGLWESLSRINRRLISTNMGNDSSPRNLANGRVQVNRDCPVCQDHGIFFRVFSCDPNSPYDVSTGIKCSGWREYSTRFPAVTRKQVLDHMNAMGEPSPFISMTDSPARLVNFRANRWDLTKVAVINATKMERIGIRHSRTTQLAGKFGFGSKSNAEPNGAKYLNSAHWLAQFWIPAECIERVMEWGDFMSVCRRESIVNGLQSR